MARILVADDEITMLQTVTEFLRGEGHEVLPFNNGEEALDGLEIHAPDLVITDLYLERNKPHGLEILKRSRNLNPPPVVILVTGFGSVETAVEAMKNGAYDYLEKPFKLEDLKIRLQRALAYNDAVSENVYLKKELKKKYRFNQIIGTSPKMQAVFKMVERVANTDSTILILGESGTGKELIARALHFNSRRQFAPFIPVNCSALPENLLESELFGHRKGAFTGAVNDKKGLFQEADSGTIFLDEIGTMPPILQSRLLRVLQEKEVRKVGDNTPVYVDVRVIAATNEPLEELVKKGSFREDLYYRLNVIAIQLPTLEERKDDIPLLVAHFLRDRIHHSSGKPFQVTRHAMDTLCSYQWPGNVRELENAIERACALAETHVIQAYDLPPSMISEMEEESMDTVVETRGDAPPHSFVVLNDDLYPLQSSDVPGKTVDSGSSTGPHENMGSLKDFLRNKELEYLNKALGMCSGDKEKTAEMLGVSLATLYRKLSEVE